MMKLKEIVDDDDINTRRKNIGKSSSSLYYSDELMTTTKADLNEKMKFLRKNSSFNRPNRFIFLLTLSLMLVNIPPSYSDEHDHTYEDGEEVVLWMNTVGPYHNRQETYGYFSLPFCRGPKKGISHYHETLSEAIQGVELEFSGLDIRFKVNMDKTVYCEITMTKENYNAFEFAIKNYYSYQMYIDDLPIMGSVGFYDETESQAYLFTHKKFDIGYNGNQIVDVNMTSEGKIKLEIGETVKFSYEVNWKPSPVEFKDRFDKYLDPNFFQHRIHWFSIFNSFMMVIFLVGLVTMILMRTLRKDYARYNRDEELDDMDRDLGDEYGWKQVHGDVFRPPAYPMMFSILMGCGYHIAFVTFVVIIFSIWGDLYTSRGSILSVAIFVYAATAIINGYFGGSLYAQFGGKQWIKQMFWSAFAIPLMVCGTAFFINFIAMYYHASRAIPFTTMLAVASICVFIILPLTLVGTVLGRNISGQPNNPCRINAVPRPIPEKKWFMEPLVIVILGGILPFGSIFIEMYFIFTSFWAYKIYYVYGFMLLVFLILAAVTSCVTIVCTYFLLNSEDYRWINAVPRPIPEKKWFMEPLVIVILGGILPFGSIFIEMYFIFTSFWAYKIYYVYGFMLLVFLILAAVTSCVTIVCTYFLLNSEDYRWQWTSFMAGASTSIYVYLYSFYYFFFKTKMYGLFQTCFYFGYMALFSIALGIMCGTFGYMGTRKFVRKIYSTVKID